jgi:hypothetical protein
VVLPVLAAPAKLVPSVFQTESFVFRRADSGHRAALAR